MAEGLQGIGTQLHETSDGQDYPLVSSFEETFDRDDRQLRKYFIYSLLVLCIICGTAVWFGQHLSESNLKLVVAIMLSGACGGILFAVRHSLLTWPKLANNSIHLGWLADCAYGVAGAFCVFLLVPGLSESANDGFIFLFPDTPNPSPNSSNGEGMELIEVIAVALVGGFAGRSVMQHAQRNVLSSKPTAAPKPSSSDHGIADADSQALTVAYQVVSNKSKSPSADDIARSIASCSRTAKQVIFDFMSQAMDPVGTDYDEAVLHILAALEKSDYGQQSHEVSALRARLLAQKARWHEAYVSTTRAVTIATLVDTDDDLKQEYRAFQEHCEQEFHSATHVTTSTTK